MGTFSSSSCNLIMGRCLEICTPKGEIPYEFGGNNNSFLLYFVKAFREKHSPLVWIFCSVFPRFIWRNFLQFLLGKDLPFKK